MIDNVVLGEGRDEGAVSTAEAHDAVGDLAGEHTGLAVDASELELSFFDLKVGVFVLVILMSTNPDLILELVGIPARALCVALAEGAPVILSVALPQCAWASVAEESLLCGAISRASHFAGCLRSGGIEVRIGVIATALASAARKGGVVGSGVHDDGNTLGRGADVEIGVMRASSDEERNFTGVDARSGVELTYWNPSSVGVVTRHKASLLVVFVGYFRSVLNLIVIEVESHPFV